jgi:hypothetical protein
MKVRNMESANGREVPNQFVIDTDDGIYYQSYNSIIAKRQGGKVYLDADKWDYSRTTSKYRNIFLRESTKETQRKIDSGEYTLADLNS